MAPSFDLSVWIPNYNFFLQSVAFSYPTQPNNTVKRKYYDLYSNFSLFIPNPKAFTTIYKILEKHPITPYLDSQMLLLKWTHKVTNELKGLIGIEPVDFHRFMEDYYNAYRPREIVHREEIKRRERMIFLSIIFGGFAIIGWFLYRGM